MDHDRYGQSIDANDTGHDNGDTQVDHHVRPNEGCSRDTNGGLGGPVTIRSISDGQDTHKPKFLKASPCSESFKECEIADVS